MLSFRWFEIVCSLLCISILVGCSGDSQKSSQADEGALNLIEMTIDELQENYDNGSFTVRQVVEYYLNRIEEIDRSGPKLNSIICVNPDALIIADQLDEELNSGTKRGPMHGVVVILKDNIDTHDKMPTTGGSLALQDSYPLHDSWVAAKLREAGAVILAKANLSEWANFRGDLSSSGWSGVGGQTHNPYNLSRNPCGSSSGSGAAVSANLCMVAIGTETNGSIVCPSSANGIAGIKSTVGLISRSGIIPISFTQDIPGPMARTVRDAAICLGALIGVDSLDQSTHNTGNKTYSDYSIFTNKGELRGKRIGLYTRPLGRNYKVDEKVDEAVQYLKQQGVTIIELEKLYDPAAGDLSFEIMLYEYKDGLNKYFASLGPDARVKSLQEVIEFNIKDSIELKFFNQELMILAQAKSGLDSQEYKDALETMLKMVREEGIDKVMDEHSLDAIIAPTGGPAWKTDHVNGDAYLIGSSSPAAIAGYPNITIPMGFVDGLPVGISFFGRAWSEAVLLEIASAYESGTKHRKPPRFVLSDED